MNPTPTPRTAPGPKRMLRVVLYYVAVAAVVVLAVRYLPGARELLEAGSSGSGLEAASTVEDPGAAALQGTEPVGRPLPLQGRSGIVLAAVSMLGALAIMVPVTWIYMVTRQNQGFNQSVLHALLILPVAVTGIVMIVQNARNSIAVAFALTGIVAAVRFRTTLEDTKDAVYIFLAIGVGLASGVQELGLALVLSLVFNGTILVLWRTRFGNVYASRGTGRGGIGLGEALVGPSGTRAVEVVGDAALLDAAAPRDIAEVLERATRMERHIAEERTKKKSRRANTLIIIVAPQASSAQAHAEAVFGELATRWKLAEAAPTPEGRVILEYLLRLDQAGAEGAILDRLNGAPDGVIEAAELRSLKGLKKRT